MMMFDIDQTVAESFFFTEGSAGTACAELHRKLGIDQIFPEATIQGWKFEPCGYSCNAMFGKSYFTIHVTPEKHCSYTSFETNVKLSSYAGLVEKVLNIFQPKVRVCVSVYVCVSVCLCVCACGNVGESVRAMLRLWLCAAQRFTMTMFADQQGVKEVADNPFLPCFDPDSEKDALYHMTARSHSEVCLLVLRFLIAL
jgi:hypothetical protein